MEDAIGLLLLILIAIALLVLIGLGGLFALDLLSCLFSWFALGPAAGWLMLGLLGGALFGWGTSLRTKTRSEDLRRVTWGGVILLVVLMIAGLLSPAGHTLFAP